MSDEKNIGVLLSDVEEVELEIEEMEEVVAPGRVAAIA